MPHLCQAAECLHLCQPRRQVQQREHRPPREARAVDGVNGATADLHAVSQLVPVCATRVCVCVFDCVAKRRGCGLWRALPVQMQSLATINSVVSSPVRQHHAGQQLLWTCVWRHAAAVGGAQHHLRRLLLLGALHLCIVCVLCVLRQSLKAQCVSSRRPQRTACKVGCSIIACKACTACPHPPTNLEADVALAGAGPVLQQRLEVGAARGIVGLVGLREQAGGVNCSTGCRAQAFPPATVPGA